MRRFSSLLKNVLLASGLAASVVSCKPDNNAPVASLSVDRSSGKSPLEVTVSSVGSDLDGDNDITNYSLVIKNTTASKTDTTINSSSPIPSFKRIFKKPGLYEITFKVTDSHGANDIATANLDVQQGTYLSQSATLFEDTKIKYSATLSDVPNAELTVKKNGVVLLTRQITDVVKDESADYNYTFDYATDKFVKGSYEFVLKSAALENIALAAIPDYKPTINLSGIVTNFKEYSQLGLTLPLPTDKNPEDVGLVYTAVRPLDNKTLATLNGLNLVLRSSETLGSYQVELEFGSASAGLEKSVLTGEIIRDPRIKVYAYKQPNDSTLNWYGSGDVDKNNVVNTADASRLLLIINGTFSDPGDTRLMDRSDVNGDGVVDSNDLDLLSKKLNGTLAYLPGYWNQLLTRSEGEAWLKKMLAIDKTDEAKFPGGDCTEIANQLLINFRGFSDKDLVEFKKKYNYDITNNGRFNIPMFDVLIDYNNGSGHRMNDVIFGDDAFIWNNNCIIEPQYDDINQQPGQRYFIGINSLLDVRGPPIFTNNIDLNPYYGYDIVNNVVTTHPFESAIVKFINIRTK